MLRKGGGGGGGKSSGGSSGGSSTSGGSTTSKGGTSGFYIRDPSTGTELYYEKEEWRESTNPLFKDKIEIVPIKETEDGV